MLPFGLRSAPKIFNAVADALNWCLQRAGICFLQHYLDDFIIVAPPNSGGADNGCSVCSVRRTHGTSQTGRPLDMSCLSDRHCSSTRGETVPPDVTPSGVGFKEVLPEKGAGIPHWPAVPRLQGCETRSILPPQVTGPPPCDQLSMWR